MANKLGLSPRMSSEVMSFMTANAVTEADQKIDLTIDEIKDTISPFEMEESPSVLCKNERDVLIMAMVFYGCPGTSLSCSMIRSR